MDFFGKQRAAKSRSVLLLILFTASMLFLAALVNLTGSVIAFALGQSESLWEFSPYALIVTGLFWFVIACGCFFRWLDVRGGGEKLAQRYGAEQVIATSRDRADNELMAVVAEMAVAASVRQPGVWVLRREPSVNAFVLGQKDSVAVVVTEGCLNLLDRDELKGVVAHEMGHVVQGDLEINMRLLIAMGGLMALDEAGRSMGARDPDTSNPLAIAGNVLCAFGSVCVLFGGVIRSAFSRKREFLADASAVQFTRNPDALATALHKIRNGFDNRQLSSLYGQELAHLCFQIPSLKGMLGRVLATHPPIGKRIDAIDPHFEVKFRARKKADSEIKWRRSQHESSAGAVNAPVLGTAGSTAGLTATAGAAEFAAPMSVLSDRLELMLPDAKACLAAVFALFASEHVAQRRQYLKAVAFAYEKPFARSVEELLTSLGPGLHTDRLAVIEYIAPRLKKQVKPENRMRLLKNLEKMVEIEGETNLENFAALQLIRRRLDAEFPMLTRVVDTTARNSDGTGKLGKILPGKDKKDAPIANARKVGTCNDVEKQIALLLGLLVEASGNNADRLEREYRRVLKCYTNREIERRSSREQGVVQDMQSAFHILYAQPLANRQTFISHCKEIVRSDFSVTKEEQVLVDLFTASLGVSGAGDDFRDGRAAA